MKYTQPYGITNPDAPYINGDPSIGRMGSIPPAAAFENHQRELVALIYSSGLAPTDDDLSQVVKSVQSQRVNAAVATNSGAGQENDIVVSLNPPIGTYTLGLPLRVIIAQDNTGNVRIDAGAGFAPVLRANGAQLQPGDLKAAMCAEFMFDGTHFQVTNFFGVSSDVTNINTYLTDIPYCADTSVIPSQITANFIPAITTLTDGNFYAVKLNNTVVGPTTIQVNTIIGGKQVLAWDGKPLQIGDAVKDEILLIVWKAATSVFQMMNPLPPRERFVAPVFPDVGGAAGTMPLGTGAGTVIIPNGYTFVWRGCIQFATNDFIPANLTLATVGSKTYHVRWHAPGTKDAADINAWPSGRFVIKDVADAIYNPGAADERILALDSSYDDMLIARVVTSAGNVATITNLANKAKLSTVFSRGSVVYIGGFGDQVSDAYTLNWARTPPNPQLSTVYINGGSAGFAGSAGAINTGFSVSASATRYQVNVGNWNSVIDRFTFAGYGNTTVSYYVVPEV